MKFSSKVEKCGQSPMRKFHPYAVAAKARGIKVYHLNIGQPDVQTPPAFFEAIRKFEQPVLEYAPSPGIPELIDAIKGYYDKLDMHFDKSEIYITTGGSEALSITLQCILDEPLQSFGSFAEEAPENIVVIDTVSKRFSACGARIGCLITKNKELLGHALKYCQSRLSVATLDQVASAHLYTVGPEYFAAVRDEYKKRRDTLVRKLREIPGVIFDCPKGAFYLMAALPVDDAEKFQQWLLEEFDNHGETVMFAPGAPMYATPGKGLNEVRMAYVLEAEKIERAMDILKKAIEVYNAK